MKTKYPITNGSKVHYCRKDGKRASGYAKKMGVASDGSVGFLVTKHRGDPPERGEWVDREQLR